MVARWTSLRWAAPGLAIALVVWLITLLRWDASAFASSEMDNLWQSAGIEHLSTDPWGTLTVLHIQPPGMNALFALDLAATPSSHALLLGLNLLLMLATIYLMVDTLRRFDASATVARVASIGYALLPSVVIYSQWIYSVSLIAFLSVVAIWGVSLMRTRISAGALVSGGAVAAAVLTRPSYSLVLLVGWCVWLIVLVLRRSKRRPWTAIAGLGLILVAVFSVQFHYYTSFGLPTMTSWSGENLAKALRASQSLTVTPAARESIAGSACQAQMLAAYEADALNRWDPAAFRGLPACADLPQLPARGVAAWDSPLKGDSGVGNFVWSDRLVASREWTSLMTTVVRHDPWQLLRMAFTTDYGPRSSGIGLYLSAAEDYPFVTQIRNAQPLAVPLGVWSLVFAPIAWTLIILGIVLAVFGRSRRLRSSPLFWSAVGLAGYHLVVNTLFEYSENMRYRAEIDGVLMVAAMMVVSAAVRIGDR